MTYGRYKKYRPWLYQRRHPILWWVKKWAYVRFILRELSSLAVAFYAVVLLLYVRSVSAGPEAFAAFSDWLASPTSVALHLIALGFAVFHSYTWFNLAPKAMVVHLKGKKISEPLILVMNYAMWIVVSAGLFVLFTSL